MFDKLKGLAEKAKLKELADKAKNVVATTANLVRDLNGDGVVDEEDARIAAEWARKTAKSVGDEASRLGKQALRSDIVKDAASHAAIGAAIAVPIPVIGPIAGAAIGAGVGAYRNVTKNVAPTTPKPASLEPPKDVHAELLKLDDLRQKGVLTETEFESEKKKLLDND